ncbi:hypothetical protein [Hyalangium rubrum]|uniref:Calpain catalytic domain-containing protein n=1 Tax=Hyalangium rubrum TaxID=3103134 RepID=A0ABU5H1P7_9BACT|nr:hypothetical protein [Hyalangium sp. s54d21]MDY7227373.1 hypothetical protein [Hyalangium sp. s54d21]
MTTLTSVRFSSVIPQTGRSSSSGASSANPKPAPVAPGFSGESRFEAAPTRNGATAAPSSPAEKGALQEMEKLFKPAASTFRDNGSTVTTDAADVESPSNSKTGARGWQATEQLKANERLEQQRLASLFPQQRAQYTAVKEATLNRASNPVAALALQKLLFEGKLAGGKDLAGKGTVLDHLVSAAWGDTLDGRVDRNTFVTDLVQELATPSAINQGSRGTCAPTAMSINLALNHPAEYARIMRDLASPSGTVTLADGKTTLTREAETSFLPDGSGRALTQRLMAPVFMEASNGERAYNDWNDSGAGASATGLDALHDAVYGRNMAHKELHGSEARDEAMKQIDSELASGQNVLAGIWWNADGGHEVLITGTEKLNGQDYLKFINPWGTEERMLRSVFHSRLIGINYDPAEAAKPGPAAPFWPVPGPFVTPRPWNRSIAA